MFDKIIAAVQDVANVLLWYAVAVVVSGILYQFTLGDGFDAMRLVAAVVTAVAAGITTALVIGSLDGVS